VSASGAPPPAGYRIPSLGYRILAGGLLLLPLLVLLVGLPDGLLAFLQSKGINLPISILTVTLAGLAIAVLSTARYILKPTRAYGPVWMAGSAVAIAYLLTIYAAGSFVFNVPGHAIAIGIGFAGLIGLLLIVPALSLCAGIVTTVEDWRSPGERLPFDFPA
jgi:hypothetical protein